MTYLLYTLNALIMLVAPLLLASLIDRRSRVGWGLFGVGAATFIGSQLFHLPFNWIVGQLGVLPKPGTSAALLALALFAGLSAGVFEEGGRYLAYRFWARDARSWYQGLMMGAGHGGIEAIILGLLVTVNFSLLFGVRHGLFQAVVPEDQLPELLASVDALLSVPWYYTLLGAVERLLALTAHLALSLLVMQCFTRNNGRWLLLAIGWHTLLNAVAVFVAGTWGAVLSEAALGLVALASLVIILALRPFSSVSKVTVPPAPVPALDKTERLPGPKNLSAERLEESKYQ